MRISWETERLGATIIQDQTDGRQGMMTFWESRRSQSAKEELPIGFGVLLLSALYMNEIRKTCFLETHLKNGDNYE